MVFSASAETEGKSAVFNAANRVSGTALACGGGGQDSSCPLMPDQPLLTEPAQEPQIGAQSLCSGVSRKRWLCYLLIGFVVLLVWGHTVTFQFVWDDEWFIRDHKTIQSLKNVPAMFYSLEAQSSLPEG